MWRPQSPTSQTALLLLAKRNILLGGVLLLAVLFLANGIYILAKGRMSPQRTKMPQASKVLPNADVTSIHWCFHTSCIGSRFHSEPSANRRCCRLAHLPSGQVPRVPPPGP